MATPIAPTSASPHAEAQAVIDAYRSFWKVYEEAGDPVNPADPRLAVFATDPLLKRVAGSLLVRKAAGEVIKGETEIAPAISRIEAESAEIADCSLDHSAVFDASTGALKEPADERRTLDVATMLKIDGQWKVSDHKLERYGCTPGD